MFFFLNLFRKKNVNGTRDPSPFHGECHKKSIFFWNLSLRIQGFFRSTQYWYSSRGASLMILCERPSVFQGGAFNRASHKRRWKLDVEEADDSDGCTRPRGASLPIMGLLVHIAMRTPIILDFLCAWIRPWAQKICSWSQSCARPSLWFSLGMT